MQKNFKTSWLDRFVLRLFLAVFAIGLVAFSCGPDQSRESTGPLSTIKIFIGDHARLIFDGLRALPANYTPPSSVSGFNCLAVNVMAKDIPSQSKNESVETVLSNLLNGSSSCSYPGIIAFADPADNSVTVQVRAGTTRVIQMVGIQDLYNSKVCETKVIPIDNPSSGTSPTPTSSSNSPLFYEVGRTVTDLFSNQTISINNSYDSLSQSDKLNRMMNKCCNPPMQYILASDRCVCPTGFSFDNNTRACRACPSDTIYDALGYGCRCTSLGSYFDSSKFACACSGGATYNASAQKCECPSGSTLVSNGTCASACPTGFKLDTTTGFCTAICSGGLVFDPPTNSCIKPPTATPTFSPSSSPSTTSCAAGLVFNPLAGQCATCPSGSSYNSVGPTCGCPAGTAPSGLVYSSFFIQSSFSCVCTLPSGSIFNAGQVGSQDGPCPCPTGLTVVNGVCQSAPSAETNYRNLILSESALIAYYPLNEPAGSATVSDLKSGPFGSLNATGGISFGVAGPFAGVQPGSGVFLNGISGVIQGSGSNSYNFGTGGFTLEAWVKTDITPSPTPLPTGGSFVNIRNNAGSTQMNLGPYPYTFPTVGPVLIVKGAGGGPYNATAGSPPSINDNLWHHLVATYAFTGGSTYGATLYIDGNPVGSTPSIPTGPMDATGVPAGIWIGQNLDSISPTNAYIREAISSLAVYNAPLSSSAVNCHYKTAKGLSCVQAVE